MCEGHVPGPGPGRPSRPSDVLFVSHLPAALIPVNGAWDEWSPWSLCSSTCGRGFRSRTRTCTPPQFGGEPCVGPEKQTKFCNIAVCPGRPARSASRAHSCMCGLFADSSLHPSVWPQWMACGTSGPAGAPVLPPVLTGPCRGPGSVTAPRTGAPSVGGSGWRASTASWGSVQVRSTP